jgi:hypothetical protein
MAENMIPKIIHYVWLSDDPIPPKIQVCMDSWKRVLPEYEIKCWNKRNFDTDSIPWVMEACREKKWAFACDYIRLSVLYTEGGLYLDSDVLIKKSFDQYLGYDFFTSVEYHPAIFEQQGGKLLLNSDGLPINTSVPIPGIGIQAAILGGIKGHSYLKFCLDYYTHRSFINADGSHSDKEIAPTLFAQAAEYFGFKYIDKIQYLRENMLILPSAVFASTRELETEESVAVHCCAGSWRIPMEKGIVVRFKNKIKNIFKSVPGDF